MGDLPLRTPTHRRFGGPLHRQLPNATHAHPRPESLPLTPKGCPSGVPRGIRPDFSGLSPCTGQVAYVLLTRAPVAGGGIATSPLPLDLHVLSLSLAFILSQDQTLRCCLSCFFFFPKKVNSARQFLFVVAFTREPTPVERETSVCPALLVPLDNRLLCL